MCLDLTKNPDSELSESRTVRFSAWGALVLGTSEQRLDGRLLETVGKRLTGMRLGEKPWLFSTRSQLTLLCVVRLCFDFCLCWLELGWREAVDGKWPHGSQLRGRHQRPSGETSQHPDRQALRIKDLMLQKTSEKQLSSHLAKMGLLPSLDLPPLIPQLSPYRSITEFLPSSAN